MSSSVTDLNGKDENSSPGHHVEEEDHGFIFMRRVSVKYPLCHHMTLRNTEHLTKLANDKTKGRISRIMIDQCIDENMDLMKNTDGLLTHWEKKLMQIFKTDGAVGWHHQADGGMFPGTRFYSFFSSLFGYSFTHHIVFPLFCPHILSSFIPCPSLLTCMSTWSCAGDTLRASDMKYADNWRCEGFTVWFKNPHTAGTLDAACFRVKERSHTADPPCCMVALCLHSQARPLNVNTTYRPLSVMFNTQLHHVEIMRVAW